MKEIEIKTFLDKLSKVIDIKVLDIKDNTVKIKALDDNAQYLLDLNLKNKATRLNKVNNNTYTYLF